jgi:hypothetical protein
VPVALTVAAGGAQAGTSSGLNIASASGTPSRSYYTRQQCTADFASAAPLQPLALAMEIHWQARRSLQGLALAAHWRALAVLVLVTTVTVTGR